MLMLDELNERQKQQFRQHAELVRLQTATLVNIQLKKEDQLKPTDLWQFEWDEKTGAAAELEKLTDEEIARHNAKLAAMLK